MYDRNILVGLVLKYAKRNIEVTDIKSTSDLLNDFGYNSISLVQLIVSIENSFGIIIDVDEMDYTQLTSFTLLEEIIKSKCK